MSASTRGFGAPRRWRLTTGGRRSTAPGLTRGRRAAWSDRGRCTTLKNNRVMSFPEEKKARDVVDDEPEEGARRMTSRAASVPDARDDASSLVQAADAEKGRRLEPCSSRGRWRWRTTTCRTCRRWRSRRPRSRRRARGRPRAKTPKAASRGGISRRARRRRRAGARNRHRRQRQRRTLCRPPRRRLRLRGTRGTLGPGASVVAGAARLPVPFRDGVREVPDGADEQRHRVRSARESQPRGVDFLADGFDDISFDGSDDDGDLDVVEKTSVCFFSVGFDASIAMQFHQLRERTPCCADSVTKIVAGHAVLGFAEALASRKYLRPGVITLRVDGREVPVPAGRGRCSSSTSTAARGIDFLGAGRRASRASCGTTSRPTSETGIEVRCNDVRLAPRRDSAGVRALAPRRAGARRWRWWSGTPSPSRWTGSRGSAPAVIHVSAQGKIPFVLDEARSGTCPPSGTSGDRASSERIIRDDGEPRRATFMVVFKNASGAKASRREARSAASLSFLNSCLNLTPQPRAQRIPASPPPEMRAEFLQQRHFTLVDAPRHRLASRASLARRVVVGDRSRINIRQRRRDRWDEERVPARSRTKPPSPSRTVSGAPREHSRAVVQTSVFEIPRANGVELEVVQGEHAFPHPGGVLEQTASRRDSSSPGASLRTTKAPKAPIAARP